MGGGRNPFEGLIGLPGIDSIEDIFDDADVAGNPFGGNPMESGGNPFAGGGAGGGNPFAGGAGSSGEGQAPAEEKPAEEKEYNYDGIEGPSYKYELGENKGAGEAGAGGGNPFGGGAGGGNPFGGGAGGGSPFGGGGSGSTSGIPEGAVAMTEEDSAGAAPAGGGNPFAGGAGGMNFSGMSTDKGSGNTDNGTGNQFYGDNNQADGNGNQFLSGEDTSPFNNGGVLSGENNPFESKGPPEGITGGIPFESMGGNNPVLAGGGSAPTPAGDGTTPDSAINPAADDNAANGNGNWFFGSGNNSNGNGNWNFGNEAEVEGNGNWNLGDNNSLSGNGNRPSGSDNSVSGNGNRVSGNNNKVSGNGFDIADSGMDVYGNGDRYLSTDKEGNVTLVDDKSASNPNFDFSGVVDNEAKGDGMAVSETPITGPASKIASAAMGGAALTASDAAMTDDTVISEANSAMGESDTDMTELLRQSPFGVLLDIPGVDGVEDIFGNLGGAGGESPFGGGAEGAEGGEMSIPSGNPFAYWDPVRDGNPFIQGDEPDASGSGEMPSKMPGDMSTNEVIPMSEMPDAPAAGGSTDGFGIDMATASMDTSNTDMATADADMSDAELTELLKQSPFGVLFDIPGVDSVEDIFGNVGDAGGEEGGNPFAGGGEGGNPFAGGGGGGNPFAGGGGGGNPFAGGAGAGGEEAPAEGYEYNFDDVDGSYDFDNAEDFGGAAGGGKPSTGGGEEAGGAGANPFAGGGNPFAGGGEAGGSGEGSNPMAGGGSNPFAGGGNPFAGGGEAGESGEGSNPMAGGGGNPFAGGGEAGEAGAGGNPMAGDNPFANRGENPFAQGEEPVPTDALLGGILKDDGKVTLSEDADKFFESFTGDELMEGGLSDLQSVVSGLSELQTTITALDSGELSPLELATSVLSEGFSLDASDIEKYLGQSDTLDDGIMRASGFFQRQLAYLEESGLIDIDKTVAAPTTM